MPGLSTLRPLTLPAKAEKTTASRNVVAAAKVEKVRDDKSHGQGRILPVVARARVVRALAPPQVPSALQPCKPNQVIDPAGEAVKEKFPGNAADISQRIDIDYCSSGSEHEPNSVCLAEMVFDYIEDDLEVGKCGRARCNCGNSCDGDASSTENDDARSSLVVEMADILQAWVYCSSTSERTILSVVSKLWEDVSSVDSDKKHSSANGSLPRRWLMVALRSCGYNAAICKSRWDNANGFPGGDYEYIDALLEGIGGKIERILVDVDFKTQFEIARPTSQYNTLLQLLPSVYVGKADRLQQIASIMCDAAKVSLKKNGMDLPPWRKLDYIKAKWLSSYRRTTNETSSSFSESRDGMDIEKIALKGSEWDSKFMNNMEKHYHIKGSDTRKALRECNTELSGRGISCKSIVRKRHDDEPEGRGRGVNLMGFLAFGDGRTADKDITATTTEWEPEWEWEPPLVVPRTNPRAGKVTGLVSILMDTGLTEEMRKELGETQRQHSVSAMQIAMAS